MRSAVFLIFTAVLVGVGPVVGQTPSAVPTPVPNAAVQKGYLVGPGDEITGKVLGESEFDFVATVDEDGKIEVPFFDKPVIANAVRNASFAPTLGHCWPSISRTLN